MAKVETDNGLGAKSKTEIEIWLFLLMSAFDTKRTFASVALKSVTGRSLLADELRNCNVGLLAQSGHSRWAAVMSGFDPKLACALVSQLIRKFEKPQTRMQD
jgi:hypothetical protein